MKFRVTSKSPEGEETKRVLEAASRFAVYEQVEKEGGVVVSVQEGSGTFLPAWTQMTIGTGINTDEKITFTKNLAAMIAAGLTLTRALSVIERQTKNKALKKIVMDLEGEVKKGSSFHETLAR
ncbi:MAG: type II secretion system F family protein, partial [bacterium]|nr:type II secretion system F family protein [bacterium]